MFFSCFLFHLLMHEAFFCFCWDSLFHQHYWARLHSSALKVLIIFFFNFVAFSGFFFSFDFLTFYASSIRQNKGDTLSSCQTIASNKSCYFRTLGKKSTQEKNDFYHTLSQGIYIHTCMNFFVLLNTK